VQAWRTSNPVATATAKGNRVIVSAGYYLSQLQPAEFLYAIDPLDPNAYATMSREELALVRRNPASAALVSDGLAPTPQPALTAEQERLVLGGEAPVWAEAVSDETLDIVLWPRALTVGERFWSSASLRDVDSMYRRLIPAMDRLRALGLQDEQRRQRMLSRLAPDAPDVVQRLVEATAPVRNFARFKLGAFDPIELPDAASADGSMARRFRIRVTDYLSGDNSILPLLTADLSAWRDNERAFAKVATGRPLLELAIPTASDIAALGRFGLAALTAREAGKPMATEQLAEARALVAKLKAFEDASENLMASSTMKQPPADLIVLVAPDVGRLVEAAAQGK
jgi:hexosaminidase